MTIIVKVEKHSQKRGTTQYYHRHKGFPEKVYAIKGLVVRSKFGHKVMHVIIKT